MRIGLGQDIHRLVAGRPLILGGVAIPHQRGLSGHSDADVVLHALADALLGAAALGDIGELFPDTDPAYEGLDSAQLLREVCRRVRAAGWRPVNADLVVQAAQPKLGPYKSAMRERIAELIEVPADCVGLQAKGGEGLGPVGRGQAISCQAVVLLEPAGTSHKGPADM